MMSDVYPVTITLNDRTQRYTPIFQVEAEFEQGWQSVLKAAYGRAELRCGCAGVGPKRLAVKYYEGADRYSLARFSRSGSQHSQRCQYYSAGAAQSGQGAYGAGVIDERPDGSVKIRLEIGVVERPETGPADPDSPRSNRQPSAKRASMKLLGLLHYLWEEARLNEWKRSFASARNASGAYRWINNAADNVWVGHFKLVDLVLLPAFRSDSREAERNRARAAAALEAKHRMLIIAPLAAYTPEQADAMTRQLKIGAFHGMPLTFMPGGLWESTVRRFPNAIAGWRDGHGAVAIAQVELKQGRSGLIASVIDLALMTVTPEFIPVESSYERVVANLLVAQGRSFTKPLRYDAGADKVLPDFILMDTRKEIPLEVFGRDDADYLKRKEAKTALYNEQYGRQGWWSWDAAKNSAPATVPPFPVALGSPGG
jgi:hypothetical protein